MLIRPAALLAVLTLSQSAGAFVNQQSSAIRNYDTSLSAVAPSFIIGPMIKKMREDKEKKRMPMAAPDEASMEAPGLRVGKEAWKWPPVWPYDTATFLPNSDQVEEKPDLAGMAGIIGGTPTAPPPTTIDEADKLNPLKYWGEENSEVLTELSQGAVDQLKNHYSFYLKDGMSVLELGAAEESYLPEGLKLSRHVGVGASKNLMNKNSALTESMVVDLNDVEAEKGVNSDELRRLASEPFDVIISANTIDFLTNPREVFKSAWYLLKPGGTMVVSFSNKDAYTSKFGTAQTKMWTDFNDDQHMWVCGSFFQFSAGEGWTNLRGFDISPEGAKKNDDDGPLSFLQNQGENTNLYVVQADKSVQEDGIDPADPEKSFKSKMWMLPTMEDRDKILVAPRLRRAFELTPNADFLSKQVDYLPAIYESLIKMDQFAFTFNMQASLAVDLAADPEFCANEEQLGALKQGLGLRTPSEEFWGPVGQLTLAMDGEDKINLLAHLIPRFGSGDPEQEAALQAFVTGMKPTFAHIRQQCPSFSESDVQLLGTEFLAAEVLKPKRSSREEFAKWLGAYNESELTAILDARKRPKTEAASQLQQFRDIRAAAKKKEEDDQEALKKQVDDARAERTMDFNARTGKFEKAEEKKK